MLQAVTYSSQVWVGVGCSTTDRERSRCLRHGQQWSVNMLYFNPFICNFYLQICWRFGNCCCLSRNNFCLPLLDVVKLRWTKMRDSTNLSVAKCFLWQSHLCCSSFFCFYVFVLPFYFCIFGAYFWQQLLFIVLFACMCGVRSHPSVVVCSRSPCCRLSQYDSAADVSACVWRHTSSPLGFKSIKLYQWYAAFTLDTLYSLCIECFHYILNYYYYYYTGFIMHVRSFTTWRISSAI